QGVIREYKKMLERIILAGVITFCVYLFLNVSSKSSNSSIIDAKWEEIAGFAHQAAFFSF
ncbi:MAG: hypothetical protein AAFQ23_07420, partial [Cyanobacteria bacterium J06623_1]